MRIGGLASAVAVGLFFTLALPSSVGAQSAFAGVIKDTTGAALPGVTVEASSPALIEKSRTVVTDEHGEFKIVDLQPGTYAITFSLEGFSTVKRTAIDLPSNFTMTLNIEMRVGAVEETVVVSGIAPVVDVQTTETSEILPRDVLDAVPTGRTVQGIAQLVSGVKMDQPDVGGSHAMQQTYISGHGMAASQTTVRLDGMMLNSMCGDGQVQFYTNTAIAQEIVYQTSGANADVSGAGFVVNIIPKRGGNQFSGSVTGMGAIGGWQADNFTQDLKNRGLLATDKIDHNYDFEGGFGGRIVEDKLWFFTSARRISVNQPIADTFYPDGRQGVDDQYQQSIQTRLTWQMTPRNQFTAYWDRVHKYRGHAMSAGYDPQTAANVWNSPLYQAFESKWTSTVSTRLLFEAGFSSHQDRRQTIYEPGIAQPYESTLWFRLVNHNDLSLGTNTVAAPNENYTWPTRRYAQGSATYVSGSHNAKIGIQDSWGSEGLGYDANGDLRQQYLNGVPVSVVVMNTPIVRSWSDLNADIAIFAQDSWTLKRLTVNYGARWEYWHTSVPAQANTPGRFAPNGSFPGQDMPISKTLSPRGGIVYDLFGNAKTAVKFSVGRYEQAGTYGLANTYNPIALASATLSWTDLNHDDVAAGAPGCVYLTPGCEINFAQLPVGFGTVTPGCSMLATPSSVPCGNAQVDPNLKRIYSMNYNLGVQHELLPRVSVSANWYHVDYYNLRVRANVLQTFADYTPQNVVSPLDGSVITIYNVSKAKVNQVQYVDMTASSRSQWYNGLEFTFNARLGKGATLFGGTSTDRTLAVMCDEPSNPNYLAYCDQTKSGIPWRTQFKLVGSVPLWYGIQFSGSFQSVPGLPLGTAALGGGYANAATTQPNGLGPAWLITPATRYAANCTGPCTPGALVDPGMTVASISVPLLPPGTRFADRINDVDLTIGKWFNAGRVQVQPEGSVFNVLNASSVYAVRSLNYGTSSYLQPSSVLQGRYVRLGVQVKW
jgi:hypothetical protein